MEKRKRNTQSLSVVSFAERRNSDLFVLKLFRMDNLNYPPSDKQQRNPATQTNPHQQKPQRAQPVLNIEVVSGHGQGQHENTQKNTNK